MYPLIHRWRVEPRSSQKMVLIPSNQKTVVRIKAKGRDKKRKSKNGFQLELIFLFKGDFCLLEGTIKLILFRYFFFLVSNRM
jgi:hypothetical protein